MPKAPHSFTLTDYHRTFIADLYEQVCRRHKRTYAAVLQAQETSAELAEGNEAILAVLDEGKKLLRAQARNWPPRTWKSAIGLGVSGSVSEGSKHEGTYTIQVNGTDENEAGFKITATGPEGMVEWWPGCGFSELDACLRIGAHRHTLTRLFGLEAKGNS